VIIGTVRSVAYWNHSSRDRKVRILKQVFHYNASSL